MTNENQLIQAAVTVRDALAKAQLRLVLAESCTAGKVASSLAVLPGASAWFCGSFVVYRNESKARWLDIPRSLIEDPAIGPVSPEVTRLLARRSLFLTPEANISVAVTGHVGPGSPVDLDGRVFFASIQRDQEGTAEAWTERATVLKSPSPKDENDFLGRSERLAECARWVLEQIHTVAQMPQIATFLKSNTA